MRPLLALLLWIATALFAVLSIGGLFVALSNLWLVAALVALAAALATRLCWVQARKRSARLLAGEAGDGPGFDATLASAGDSGANADACSGADGNGSCGGDGGTGGD